MTPANQQHRAPPPRVLTEHQLEVRERWITIGLLVLGIVFILLSAWMEPEPGAPAPAAWVILAHLVRDLGIALVIAAALAFAVDKYLKQRLVSSVATEVSNEVAQNTSKYVFGYLVPPEMKEELLELMRPAVLRRSFTLAIELEPYHPNFPSFVRVVTKIKYTLANLKDQETLFRHTLRMTNLFADKEAPKVLRFSCYQISRDTYLYDYQDFDSLRRAAAAYETAAAQGAGKPLEVIVSPDQRDLTVYRSVDIPPLSEDFEFRTESSEIMQVPYADVFSFADATAGIEVRTRYPADMEVLIEFGKGREVPFRKDPPNRPTYWQYGGVMLAGQHIRYDFKKLPNHAAPPGQGTPTTPPAAARPAAPPPAPTPTGRRAIASDLIRRAASRTGYTNRPARGSASRGATACSHANRPPRYRRFHSRCMRSRPSVASSAMAVSRSWASSTVRNMGPCTCQSGPSHTTSARRCPASRAFSTPLNESGSFRAV